jgi:hypothetical protein
VLIVMFIDSLLTQLCFSIAHRVLTITRRRLLVMGYVVMSDVYGSFFDYFFTVLFNRQNVATFG